MFRLSSLYFGNRSSCVAAVQKRVPKNTSQNATTVDLIDYSCLPASKGPRTMLATNKHCATTPKKQKKNAKQLPKTVLQQPPEDILATRATPQETTVALEGAAWNAAKMTVIMDVTPLCSAVTNVVATQEAVPMAHMPTMNTIAATENPMPTMNTIAATEDPMPTMNTIAATEDPMPTMNTIAATEDPMPTMNSIAATEDPMPTTSKSVDDPLTEVQLTAILSLNDSPAVATTTPVNAHEAAMALGVNPVAVHIPTTVHHHVVVPPSRMYDDNTEDEVLVHFGLKCTTRQFNEFHFVRYLTRQR